MDASVLHLIIQLIAGAAGSNLLASAVSKLSLGAWANTIIGALGGIGGGDILGALLRTNVAGGADLPSIITQIIGGGVGGPILTAVAAIVRDALSGRPAS